MRRALVALGVLLLVPVVATVTGGCNVVTLRQMSLEADLRGADLQGRLVRAGEHQVFVWEGGASHEKPPVLLIHGFGASGVWQWSAQVADLVRDRRVVMPDLLWFGATQPAGRDFSLLAQVQMMSDLLKALKLEKVDVVGMSYGGLVAYELAARQPEHVGRLVLIDTPGRAYTAADYDALLKRVGTDDLATVLVPRDVAGVDRLLELAYEQPPYAPWFAKAQALDALYSAHRAEQVEVLHSMLAELTRISELPGAVTAPTLVLWGRNDPIFPLEVGERLAKSLSAKLVVIDSARHFVPAEQPVAVNAALREFLR